MDGEGMSITPTDLYDADDVDFETIREGWNLYKLADGTILRVKLVLTQVKRTKKYRPDGDPIYQIWSHNVIHAKVPKKLKAKPKETSGTPTV